MNWSIIYSYQVEYNDGYRTFAESLAQIELAEKLGFGTALVSEHHLVENGYFPAPFVTLSAIAMKTRTMKVGSGIIILPLYDPLHVAEHGAVLDVISNGRYILGVGQGYRKEEFEAFQVPLADRPGRMKESVEAIRALWTQPKVNMQGKHFVYKDVMVRPFPKQKPNPPIWVAAKKKSAVRLAAQVGDAWFADPITPIKILHERVGDYKSALKENNKQNTSIAFPLMREAYCAETDEKAWEEARDSMFYIYKEYLDWGHMLDDDANPVPPGDERALGLLRSRFIVGSPETCVRECLKYRELGVTDLVLRMKFPGLSHERVMNSIKLWSEKVMPQV